MTESVFILYCIIMWWLNSVYVGLYQAPMHDNRGKYGVWLYAMHGYRHNMHVLEYKYKKNGVFQDNNNINSLILGRLI